MTTFDWAVLVGYLALLVAIGSWQRRRASQSAEDYFASGRRLPWYLAGTSMIAASFASDTPLMVSGLVREHGIWRNWIWWGNAISLILTVFFFSRLWRRSRVLTEVELTEVRYGGRSAAILRGFKAVFWGLLFNAFATGAWSVTGLRKVFQSTLGMDPTVAIVACTIVAGAYSVLSGYWGVVATDCFQFVLALFGSVACAWYAVAAAGGWDAMMANVPQGRMDFVPPADGPMFGWFLSFVLVQWWAWKNTDGGGVLVQRMASCKDERHAVWATLWYQVFHTAVRGWPWVVVALASLSIVPDSALPMKTGSAGTPDHEAAYAVVIRTVLPAGLRGLIVGWFLAEFMSSINSQTNWGSSLLVNDFYKRFVNPEATPARLVLAGRVATVVVMAGAMGTAFWTGDIAQSFEAVLAGTAGIGVIVALRWLWWRVNAWTEAVALVLSPLVTMLYSPVLKPQLVHLGLPGDDRTVKLVAIVLASVLPALAATFLTRPDSDATLREFYRRVRPPGPGWRRVAALCPEVSHDLSLGRILALWLGCVAAVYGLMYGLYALLFARPWGAAATVGSVLLLAAIVHATRSERAPTEGGGA